MKNSQFNVSLGTIRLIHTIIWVTMTMAVFYVFYSGIFNKATLHSWLAVGLIFLEGLALLVGRGDCPLHVYALKQTGAHELNDTYLPQWVFFKNYKIIFTVFFLIGLFCMTIN